MPDQRQAAKEATAYHEAGHAVMRLYLERRPVSATIRPGRHSLGHVIHRMTALDPDGCDWRTRRWAETEVLCSLAGPEAERRYRGRRNNAGAESDYAWAAEVALSAESDCASAYLTWLRLKAARMIALPAVWAAIQAVAAALLERETLTGAEIVSTYRRGIAEAVRARS